MQATPEFDIHLAFSRADVAVARRLAADLEARGARVWKEDGNLLASVEAPRVLERGIGASRAVGLVLTAETLESVWLENELRRVVALAGSAAARVVVILPAARDRSRFAEAGTVVVLDGPDSYASRVDELIWPGITGRQVIFLGVHPEHRPPWLQLRGQVGRLGVRFIDGENLNRARFHIERISRDGNLRIVPVVDVFEDWPFEPWQRRNSPRQYVDFISDLRLKTRGTDDELHFLLYHHSRALEEADHGLTAGDLATLAEYPTLHRDLPEEEQAERLRSAWHRLQGRLLAGSWPVPCADALRRSRPDAVG